MNENGNLELSKTHSIISDLLSAVVLMSAKIANEELKR